MGYSYVVLSRGTRPGLGLEDKGKGRVGGVGREEAEKERRKVQGKSVLQEVEGGEYEMVSLAIPPSAIDTQASIIENEEKTEEVYNNLRSEAYSWPRLVAPPIKRSGHVIMDTCHPSGESSR